MNSQNELSKKSQDRSPIRLPATSCLRSEPKSDWLVQHVVENAMKTINRELPIAGCRGGSPCLSVLVAQECCVWRPRTKLVSGSIQKDRKARGRGACDDAPLAPPSCCRQTTYRNRQLSLRVSGGGHLPGHPAGHPLCQSLPERLASIGKRFTSPHNVLEELIYSYQGS